MRINVDLQLSRGSKYKFPLLLPKSVLNAEEVLRQRMVLDCKAIFNISFQIDWTNTKEEYDFFDYPEEYDKIPDDLTEHVGNIRRENWNDLFPISYKVIVQRLVEDVIEQPEKKPLTIWIDRKHVIRDFHKFLSEYDSAKFMEFGLFGEQGQKDIIFLAKDEEGVGTGAHQCLFNSYFEEMGRCEHLFEKEADDSLLLPRRCWTDFLTSELMNFGKMLALAKHYEFTPHMFHPLNFSGLSTNFEYLQNQYGVYDFGHVSALLAGFTLPPTALEWRQSENFEKWTQIYCLDSIAVEEEWSFQSDNAYKDFKIRAEYQMIYKFRQKSIDTIASGSRIILPWLTRTYFHEHGEEPLLSYQSIIDEFGDNDSMNDGSSMSLYKFLSQCHFEDESTKILFHCAVTSLYMQNSNSITDLRKFIAANTTSSHRLLIKSSSISRVGNYEWFLPYASTCTKTLYFHKNYLLSHEQLAANLKIAILESGDIMHLA